jgi:hypothetical protein
MTFELAAAHARAQGQTARADRMMGEAIEAYRRWGAIAKVDAMAR